MANPHANVDEHGRLPAETDIPCDVAVVFALAIESKGLVEKIHDVVSTHCHTFVERVGNLGDRRIVVVETGVGRKKAEKATDDLISIHKPAWVISAGFAAGLNEDLHRDEILMADKIVDTEGNHLSVGFQIDPQVVQATPGLHVGSLLTVDHIVCEPQEKRDLGRQHAALACDMETMAVAEACQQSKTRFMSVRVISDAVDDRLPLEVQAMAKQDSVAGKLGAAMGTLFRRPAGFKGLWKLKKQGQQASQHLAKFLLGVIRQLVGEDQTGSETAT